MNEELKQKINDALEVINVKQIFNEEIGDDDRKELIKLAPKLMKLRHKLKLQLARSFGAQAIYTCIFMDNSAYDAFIKHAVRRMADHIGQSPGRSTVLVLSANSSSTEDNALRNLMIKQLLNVIKDFLDTQTK